jgi:hypothetical protein
MSVPTAARQAYAIWRGVRDDEWRGFLKRVDAEYAKYKRGRLNAGQLIIVRQAFREGRSVCDSVARAIYLKAAA